MEALLNLALPTHCLEEPKFIFTQTQDENTDVVYRELSVVCTFARLWATFWSFMKTGSGRNGIFDAFFFFASLAPPGRLF